MAVERIRIRRDTASTWTSANPTLGLGEMGIETDTGRIKVGDGSTAWGSLAYAYEKAPLASSKSGDYSITGPDDDNIFNVTTGASDVTITLPGGSDMEPGDEIEVHKVDSGTGKVIVSRDGSDTIDGVTSIDIDSQYDMARLRWSGAYWALTEYKDHGSNADGEWTRYADGTMTQKDRFAATQASAFATDNITVDFPTVFAEIHAVTSGGNAGGVSNNGFESVTVFSATTSDFNYIIKAGEVFTEYSLEWIATGRWRA